MYFEKVQAIIAEYLDLEEDTITMESQLVDDLGADSLDAVDIAMALEDEFDIEIPDEDLEKMSKISDVVKYLEDHVK